MKNLFIYVSKWILLAYIDFSVSGVIYMNTSEELFLFASKLEEANSKAYDLKFAALDSLTDASDVIGKSFSGSWLGYHSRVYYAGFKPPPSGSQFSQEWGINKNELISMGTRGDWREYAFDEVIQRIYELAGNPSLEMIRADCEQACLLFDHLKSEIISILEIEISENNDPFLVKLKLDVEKLYLKNKHDVANDIEPIRGIISRDILAINQGSQIPPHIYVASDVISLRFSFTACGMAADIARKAASHIERKARQKSSSLRVGTNVFIGHGRSNQWLILKNFIQDRLKLPWDEFNRVPVAGITNQTRLSEMLDAAAIAFLVMTAEDEMVDGGIQARMNVVHEAGLFQGRLGFTKAIVLLEEGCSEFSNIQGLGQIRFPRDNIKAAFDEIRAVIEREHLL